MNARTDWLLEVRSGWGDLHLETRHFGGDDVVTLSSETGWYWSLCGVGLGYVPEKLAPAVAMSPPMLSDVRARVRGDFLVDAMEGSRVIGEKQGDAYVLRVPLSWSPTLVEGEADCVDDGDEMEIVLSPDALVWFQVGHQEFVARVVPPEKRHWLGLPVPDRNLNLGMFAGAVFVFALAVARLSLAPRPAINEVIELPEIRQEVVLQRPKAPEKPKVADNRDAAGGAGGGRGNGSPADTMPELPSGPMTDRAVANQAGILPGLDALADLLSGDLAQGIQGGANNLIGHKGGGPGRGGLTFGGGRGFGAGDGVGSGIAIGRPGNGIGPGGTGEGFAKKEARDVTKMQRGTVMGGLPRSAVEEVIKRRLSQIRYCYQRDLQRDPTLAGKVSIKFTIAGDGTVSTASVASSTVDSARTGECIRQRFLGMTFPKPAGGGMVIVRYPFVFSPG